MTDTQLSGTCVEPGVFELRPYPMPQDAAEGWALVDIAGVGICGTDYHIFEGKHPYLQYPRVIGHELSGHVVSGPDAGRLAVINPYLACGNCRACRRGKPNCCANIAVLGVHRDGGMCSRIAVPQTNLVFVDTLTPTQAAMVEFLAIGAHAVRRSETAPGDRVLVTGAGPIGLGVALFARLAGAEVHLLDQSAARLAKARELLGFERTYQPGPDVLAGERADGFDVVFDATGSGAAIEAGFAYLAHGATYLLVSVVKGDITFSDAEFHKREARIVGSRNATAEDFARVIGAIEHGEIDTQKLLSEQLRYADLAERLPQLVAARDDIIKVVARP